MIEKFFNENKFYKAIKEYYSQEDISDFYGMARLENQHSSFLAWLLDPKNCGSEIPIRNLLLLVQREDKGNSLFSKLDLKNAKISVEKIEREAVCRIDIFIKLNINGKKYAIVIENKIYSTLHDDQLRKYRETVIEKLEYDESHFIGVFLYTEYQNENFINPQIEEAQDNKYIPITYQNVYDEVLIPTLDSSKDKKFKNIVSEYIHILAKTNSKDGASFLVVTQQDNANLTNLFKEKQMISFIDSIKLGGKTSVENQFYNENKTLLSMCFYKYIKLNEDSSIVKKIENIINKKKFTFNVDPAKITIFDTKASSYAYIGRLLDAMFKVLLENGYTYKELNEKFNGWYLNKLIVTEEEYKDLKKQKWYTKRIEYKNEIYYILNAWNTWEYDDLKTRINELNIGIELKEL